MASNQKIIYVYESFKFTTPNFLGTLFVENVRGRESYSFEYDADWLKSSANYMYLDPDLQLYAGRQYGRTCNPGQRRSQAQISSMKPLLRHGQLTAQQNIKGRMPCIYFGLNLFCSQVAMRPPCVAIIERAKCLKLLI